jgi:hypothetical protein
VPPLVAKAQPVTQADIQAQQLALPGSVASQGNQSTLPTPSTQEEYDAIPSGQSFIDGDGMTKMKP